MHIKKFFNLKKNYGSSMKNKDFTSRKQLCRVSNCRVSNAYFFIQAGVYWILMKSHNSFSMFWVASILSFQKISTWKLWNKMLSYTECLKLDVKIVTAGFRRVSNAISMAYSSVNIKAISTKLGSMVYYT